MLRYLYICLVLITTFLLIQTKQSPQLKYNQLSDRLLHPFDTRVRYRIGHIDSRFGLSAEQVKQLTQRAAYIWQRDTGKTWFVYDENARLSINFIYDERQQYTIDYQKTQQHIHQMKMQHQNNTQSLQQTQSILNSEYESLQQQIINLQMEYHLLQSQLAQATPEQQPQLQIQLVELEQQERDLNERLASFESKRNAFNQQVQYHEQYAQQINSTIQQSKIKFKPREFHKGIFNGKEINIYEFESEQDLVLTLAHELGHALDLEHNDEPTALMYPMAQEQDLENFRLKPADLAMLKR